MSTDPSIADLQSGPVPEALTLERAALGFAALGAGARLSVLLALVKAGRKGLTVSDIQDRMGLAPSTLAHHLRSLAQAGLITQEKQGRSVVHRAAFSHLAGLGAYLLQECCAEEDACGSPGSPMSFSDRTR